MPGMTESSAQRNRGPFPRMPISRRLGKRRFRPVAVSCSRLQSAYARTYDGCGSPAGVRDRGPRLLPAGCNHSQELACVFVRLRPGQARHDTRDCASGERQRHGKDDADQLCLGDAWCHQDSKQTTEQPGHHRGERCQPRFNRQSGGTTRLRRVVDVGPRSKPHECKAPRAHRQLGHSARSGALCASGIVADHGPERSHRRSPECDKGLANPSATRWRLHRYRRSVLS